MELNKNIRLYPAKSLLKELISLVLVVDETKPISDIF